MTQHDPPLIFNIEADPSEMYPLNPDHHRSLIEETARIVAAHKASIRRVPAQNDLFRKCKNTVLLTLFSPINCVRQFDAVMSSLFYCIFVHMRP